MAMKSILLGLTKQYLNAFRTVAAPLWGVMVLLLIGGPWLGMALMEYTSGGELDRELLPADELRLVCHLLAALFFGFGCVVGLFATPTYVFRLPVSSWQLASWQFVVTSLTVVVCNGVMTVAYRVLFGATLSYAVTVPMITLVHLLIWLVWLFVPAVTAASQGRGGLLGEPLRQQLTFAISRLVRWLPAAALFVGYVVVRCWRAEEQVFWERVTAWDVVALAAISGLALKLAVAEIERQRHGEVNVRSLVIPDGESALVRIGQKQVPAPGTWSLEAAHRWFHWQSGRTLLMQGAVFATPMVLFLFGAIYLDSNGNRPGNRLEGVTVVLAMVPAMGALLIGSSLGLDTANGGTRREMRKHLAVLPVSDRDLSRVLLANLVRTVSGLWGMVCVLCVLVVGLFCIWLGLDAVVEDLQRGKAWQNLGFWVVPLFLLASVQMTWTIGGLAATLAWTGREQFFTKVFLGLIAAGVPMMILMGLDKSDVLQTVLLGLVSAVTVTLVVWSFRRASERELLQTRLVHGAFAIWAVEALLCLCLLPPPFPARLAVAALLGLSVLPITASPLAVAWNRHR